LQSVVGEVYGPTDEVRRQVAAEMTGIFKKVPFMGDVDNYMLSPHDVLHFKVDTEKAVRRGISTDTINRNVAMAMGGHRLGDVKQGKPLEPIYVVLVHSPALSARTLARPAGPAAAGIGDPSGIDLALGAAGGIGRFEREPWIHHLQRPALNEYVVGDVVGRLGRLCTVCLR
jgi:hypothetical protein